MESVSEICLRIAECDVCDTVDRVLIYNYILIIRKLLPVEDYLELIAAYHSVKYSRDPTFFYGIVLRLIQNAVQ